MTIPVSLNLNVRGMGLSATLDIKEKCQRLRKEGRLVFDFGLGQSPFPVPKPMVEALRLSAPEKDYLSVKGLPELREAVAKFHQKKDLINAHADRILIGPGSKELMFLLQLAYYGEIILPTPCWVSYLPQAKIIGRRNSLIHSTWETAWKVGAGQLHDSLQFTGDEHRPRILVLNYPNNPTGDTYTNDELQEIAEVARKFGIIILSDEIYGQLRFDGRHVSISRYYPEGTIISSGISKWCGAGGWRLGTFVFPPDLDWLVNAMAAIASETYTSVSAPIQYGAVRAFLGGLEIERYLSHVRRVLAALGGQTWSILSAAGVRVNPPLGAFYLFLDFSPMSPRLAARSIHTGRELCERILEDTGVAMLPGAQFGGSRSDLTARLSYVDFDGAACIAASENIPLDESLPDDFVTHYCSRVIEGANRIAGWVQNLEHAVPGQMASVS
jgi:aspartate aminotransferase